MAGLPQQVNGLQDISQQIQTAAWDIVLSRYISAAALTWLLYDHVLTFEKERTWIWSNKVTITKVLFLINRYSTPLVILAEIILYSGRVRLSDNACRGWLFFEALWQSFSALVAQFLLGLRMCAIWGSRPWTKVILYLGCLVCAGASITSITIALARVSSSYHYFTPLQVCYTTEPLPSWLWAAFFLPIMVFDLLIFLMTVWNVVLGHSEHVRKNSLTFMMWRDGTIYFGLIFASELACVLISALKGFSTTMTIKFAVWSLQNVVIGHMTINLVEAVRGPSADIVPTSFLDLSTHDLSGRPSASMIWKARKSTIVDTIDVDGSHGSPIIFTRTLPSQPEGATAARIMSHEDEWTRNPDTRDFNVLPTIGQDWNDSSFGWQDLFRGDEARWAEVYSSGKAERSHAIAGSSKQAATFEPDRPDDPEADGSVIPVGTGRSRLLTTSNRRPSILTKEDVAELMGHGSSLGHDLVGVNRHALWGSDVGGGGGSERVPSRAVSSSEGYHPAVVVGDSNSGKAEEDSSLQRRKRMDQLVQALTTPPSPTVPLSPLSPRRPGFF